MRPRTLLWLAGASIGVVLVQVVSLSFLPFRSAVSAGVSCCRVVGLVAALVV